MLGPVDADIAMGIGMGVGDMTGGFPTLQSTGGDITVIGAMLNVPVAMNWTCPLAKFCASAAEGVTIRL